HRYGFISGLLAEAVLRSRTAATSRRDRSERIDSVLMHPVWGLPIFAALMYITFQITFTVGDVPMGWIGSGIDALGEWVAQLWPKSSNSWVRDMITTGIIPGVGGVLVFLPNIMLLFLAIAFLEGTGYMARAAFLTDRLMHRIGLHGRSFIPMLIGFGCTVPAIMATRTIENKRDRLTTILILPLFSCGARYPIYALIIPVFFPVAWQGAAFFGIYILGAVLALVFARIFRKTLLKGDAAEFVMELPPYRMPPIRGLLAHMWLRCYAYLKKAATIIFAFSMILWVLSNYPHFSSEAPPKDFYRDDVVKIDPAPAVERLIDAEEGFAQAAESHWPDAPEYKAAKKAWHDAQQAAAKAHPWYEIAQKMHTIDEHFQRTIDEHELCEWTVAPALDIDGHVVEPGKPNPEYHYLAQKRDKEFDALKAANPAAFVLAETYLEQWTAHIDRQEYYRSEARRVSIQGTFSGMLGKTLEPAVETMGFDWKIATALVGATGGKELFVSQLGIVYAVGDAEGGGLDSLRAKLKENYSPLIGWCVMMFCLISMPCVATVAITIREAGWRWAGFQLFYLTALAWGLTTAVYQIGTALGG
ncbi:MAG: ferrous iron transporter B, partial [Phycisphaerales bacterium]|nr:ferrous iron transporter B [Phycisphaerales bacterium]